MAAVGLDSVVPVVGTKAVFREKREKREKKHCAIP